MKLAKITPESPVYNPSGYLRMSRRRLIWEKTGAKYVQVSVAEMEVGGGKDMHSHQNSEHIFYVIEGKLRVKSDKEEVEVEKGTAVLISPGELHLPSNPGPGKAIYLVINAPPIPPRPEELK